jgi:glycosyltransferase involved in cell wall biosynthesis
MTQSPRVSIGIPTYNGASMLERAIDSALMQLQDLEVVITDNASTDGTQAICERYAARDPRVRYVRHPSNLGAAANFVSALQLARGHYFMWLGDDAWLDPGYVKACTNILDQSAEHSLVSGMTRYFEPGASAPCREDQVMVLEQRSSEERVLAYFALLRENGVFFGVSRREQLLEVGLGSEFGADWSLVACFAYLGKVRTLQTVCVNRTSGGAGSLTGHLAPHGLSGFFAQPENHEALLAWKMYLEVSRNADTFKPLGVLRRQWLGLLAADTLLVSRYRTKTFLVRSRIAPRRRITELISYFRSTFAR